jgi:Tfp pilus assembly protein PilV
VRSEVGNHGFTLVEALISMTVLAVGIVGVLAAFSLSSRSGSEAMRLAEAALIADRQLQQALGSDGSDFAPQGASGPYKWEVKVTDLREGLQLASVVVKWSDRGRPGALELSEVFLPRPQDGH